MIYDNYDIPSCRYKMGSLREALYLVPWNDKTIKLTEDSVYENLNGIAAIEAPLAYLLHTSKTIVTNSESVDNRFFFSKSMEVRLLEQPLEINYSILQKLISEDFALVFKDNIGDSYLVNVEFAPEVTYQYTFNDETYGNVCTVNFKINENQPIFRCATRFDNVEPLNEKVCSFQLGKVEKLQLLEYNKGYAKTTQNGYDLHLAEEEDLKEIDWIDNSFTFVDEYDGKEFKQTLTFNIPFDSYKYYFHYNLLEFQNNRYLAQIVTTNRNFILGGFKAGLFPSYEVSTSEDITAGNTILVRLEGRYNYFNTLVQNGEPEKYFYDDRNFLALDTKCVEGLSTVLLIRVEGTNDYYCLEGWREYYSSLNIIGTYNRDSTAFKGVKVADYSQPCGSECKVLGLPSAFVFTKKGQQICVKLTTNSALSFTSDGSVSITFDGNNLCVTSLVENGENSLTVVTECGDTFDIPVIMSNIEGNYDKTIYTTAEKKTINVNLSMPCGIKEITVDNEYGISIRQNQARNGLEVDVNENYSHENRNEYAITVDYICGYKETILIVQDHRYTKNVWIDTVCDGIDKYQIIQIKWGYTPDDCPNISGQRKGALVEENSIECLNEITNKTYISSTTICYDGYLYFYDTYDVIGNMIDFLVKKEESDCDDTSTKSEWRMNQWITTCFENKPVYVEELWISPDNGEHWYNTKTKRPTNIEAPESEACDIEYQSGCKGVIYRWVDTNETYCLSEDRPFNSERTIKVYFDENNPETYICYEGNMYSVIRHEIDALGDGHWRFIGNTMNELKKIDSDKCPKC